MTGRLDGMTGETQHPALSVSNLTAGYDGSVVLRDLSLVVPTGSVTALLGPNGAGKTTLLRSIAGLIRPSDGEIRIHGRDVSNSPPHLRSRNGLCFIPEGRGIFPHLTVRENILVQSLQGEGDAALDLATSAFAVLGQRLDQRAGTLSGGQQQMLAMVAAHVRRPSLILVDEASLGLAPIIIDEIYEFLRQCADGGTAILIVDQYASRALSLATTAYVIRKGEVVYDGAADELSRSDIFARYLGSEPSTSREELLHAKP